MRNNAYIPLGLVTLLLLTACHKAENNTDENLITFSYNHKKKSYESFLIQDLEEEHLFTAYLDGEKNLIGKTIDVNGDAKGDIQFLGLTDADWYYGITTKSARLTLKPLNTSTFLYQTSVSKRIFSTVSIDTTGMNIDHSSISSQDSSTGSTYSHSVSGNYIQPFYLGETIYATGVNWTNNEVRLAEDNFSSQNISFGPDSNGYYINSHSQTNIHEGPFPSADFAYVPYKYNDKFGTKLGYLKVSAYAVGSSVWLSLDRAVIQR